jgi:hypothetical protein
MIHFFDLLDLTTKTEIALPKATQDETLQQHLISYIDIPMRMENYFIWSSLLHMNALIYNLLIVPIRTAVSIGKCLASRGNQCLTIRSQIDFARVIIILFCTSIVCQLTSPSPIYHWIRGQGNFKLYLLRAVCCVTDFLLRTLGLQTLETFNNTF